MKEEIEKFKKENGNSNHSSKELLMYAITRIEKIDNKFDTKFDKLNERLDSSMQVIHGRIDKKLESKTFYAFFSGLIGLIGLAISTIFGIFGKIFK